jgi:hypothetical protein
LNLTQALKRRLFNQRRYRRLSGTAALFKVLDLKFPANGLPDFKALCLHFLNRKSTLPGPAFSEKSLILQLLERHFPEERTQILSQADQLGRGHLTLFQNITVDFKKKINWHATLDSDKSWPLLPPSQIDCRCTDRPGDVKLVWELNRHQFFHVPGKAFWYTGDEKYLRLVKQLLKDWIEQNPPGRGINWESSLEVSIRLVSWCWLLFYFQKQPAFFDAFFPEFLKSVFEHAEFIYSNLSDWGNNHVIGEAAGLWLAALVFPEFNRARKWQKRARAILETEITQQVTIDGVSRENSVCYHRFVLDFYLLALHSGARQKLEFSETVTARVREMLLSLDAWCRPDRKFPRLGDDDSSQGLLFNPEPEAAYYLALGAGSYFFKTRLFNTRLIPNLIWLLGAQFQEIEAFSERPATPVCLRRGSYLIFRGARTPESDFAIFDAGELGLPPSFSHAHSDRLNLELILQGIPIFEDSGTFTYNGAADWRNFFRSARAHSTLSINHADQALTQGTFRWSQPPQTEPPLLVHNPIATIFSGAYGFAAGHPAAGKKHRRLILHLQPGHWLLVDLVTSCRDSQISYYFQFAPENQLIRIDESGYLIRHSSRNFQLDFRNTAEVSHQIHFGDENFRGGWLAPDYGIRQPRPTLEMATEKITEDHVLNLTYLSPLETGSRRAPLDLKWLPVQTSAGQKIAPTTDLFGFGAQVGAMFVTLVLNVNTMEIKFLDHEGSFPLWLKISEPGKELTLTGDFKNGSLKFFSES